MEVEEENVPSVGHTEEVPHDASQDIAEPLGSEPLPDSNGTDVNAIAPLITNVKYLFCKVSVFLHKKQSVSKQVEYFHLA